MGNIIPIIIFILILGVVVLVHEFGHFIMARRAGIFVEEFALGMGPKLLTFRGKKKSQYPVAGEEDVTLYTLRMFPVGGFCKMRGQDEDIPNDPEAMNNKGLFARILVIAGGSAMNFILAFLIFFGLVMMTGYHSSTIQMVQEGSPAQAAGLQAGDRITHINGARATLWENLTFFIEMSGGRPLDVQVNRNGQRMHFEITPAPRADGWFIGFYPARRHGVMNPPPPHIQIEQAGILGSASTAAERMLFHIRAPFRLLARFIAGDQMPEGAGIMGPIGIAGQVTEVYQEAAQYGAVSTLFTMLMITAVISTAIGIMNLLPIPAMDGARLIFLILEGIRRKPVPQEREAMVHLVGFVILIGLGIFVAYRDIINLIGRAAG